MTRNRLIGILFDNEDDTVAPIDPAVEFVERIQAESAIHQQLVDAFYNRPAISVVCNNLHQQHLLFNFQQHAINWRWEYHYNETAFHNLVMQSSILYLLLI
jgi:regulator of extracellular matrix RemA (YlzA/DUF370 family)